MTGSEYLEAQAASQVPATVARALTGKGQLALLVTDAAGNVIAGIRATGGLTQLHYLPQDGTWEFHGAFSGPEVLEGSYVLRNNLGMDPEPDEPEEDRSPPPYNLPLSAAADHLFDADPTTRRCRRCGWWRVSHPSALGRSPAGLPRRQPS